MNTTAITAIIIAVFALGVAVWAVWQTQRTKHLRTRFGAEYDYTVERKGSQLKAESELARREKTVSRFAIHELTPQQRDQFADAWRQQQAQFVDNPRGAVLEADALVTRVMAARGYPMADFETQAAYASVEHGQVVKNYREAHGIAERNRSGQADTEELRHAMICYRALFEDLVGASVVSPI